MPRIDFNCDLGEGCGDDAAIMPWITSANIACGAHAGDLTTMRETLRLCREHGVMPGAHREHFGRRERTLSHAALVSLVRDQVATIDSLAREEGVTLHHVKPHGALYNLSARDLDTAMAVAEGVRAHDPSLLLVGLSGSYSIDAATACGLRSAHEVFAERGYADDGRLLPRGGPGAIHASDAAIAQALGFALRHEVVSQTGRTLRLRADTLCLHGDRSDAADIAHRLHSALTAVGVRIRPLELLR
jgi:5-oxoprolinase (ATP-hydrolysing) subunit A